MILGTKKKWWEDEDARGCLHTAVVLYLPLEEIICSISDHFFPCPCESSRIGMWNINTLITTSLRERGSSSIIGKIRVVFLLSCVFLISSCYDVVQQIRSWLFFSYVSFLLCLQVEASLLTLPTYHYQTSDILINSPLRKDASASCINSGIYSSHRIYLQAIGKGIGSDDDAGASVGILLCF